jgi:hypothetical protein
METTMNLLRKAVYGVGVVLHDYVLFGILRLTSGRFREHQAYVKAQHLHLNGLHADAPAAGCDYCALRVADGWFDR